MKKTILQTSIFLSLFLITSLSQAQVTITESSFPRLGSFTDTVYRVEQAGLTLPSEGPAQVWDYSSLGTGELITLEHFDATNDADIPDALNYYQANISFQSFIIPAKIYEAIDADGWYNAGGITEDVIYSITAISGGPNDSLRFPARVVNYDTPIDFVQFPATYQSQWTQSVTENTNFELTIAAFGLNKTPGFQQRVVTEKREVVGYGTLKIPKSDGTPTDPMEVLLLKSMSTTVDSFFLGGAPAPAALLGAFGLTQGAVALDSFYVFYKPDFAAPVLNINLTFDFHFYRPQSADVSTSAQELNRPVATTFPNPVAAGQILGIKTTQSLAIAYASLTDLNGRLVYEASIESATGYLLQLQIPERLEGGMYIYQIKDKKGNAIDQGKIVVN